MTKPSDRDDVQKLIDAVCHYRNLAISCGAKPDDMLNLYDKELCAVQGWDIVCGEGEGWVENISDVWEMNEKLQQDLDEALRKLGMSKTTLSAKCPYGNYDDRTGTPLPCHLQRDHEGNHKWSVVGIGSGTWPRAWDR